MTKESLDEEAGRCDRTWPRQGIEFESPLPSPLRDIMESAGEAETEIPFLALDDDPGMVDDELLEGKVVGRAVEGVGAIGDSGPVVDIIGIGRPPGVVLMEILRG